MSWEILTSAISATAVSETFGLAASGLRLTVSVCDTA